MPVLIDVYSGESSSDHCITVGLINNMPDEALKATERQYISLLDAASDGVQVRLSLYTLPGVPRNEASSRHIASLYSNIEDLWEGQLDGLIVTGREPLAPDLKAEPYWESFTNTLAWAQENAHSTVWSCLAAHAAVLHLDGINRAKRNDKLFGIFPCSRLTDHPLMAKAPAALALPHSRWNSLPEDQLLSHGYSVLTRTSDTEVDTFIKQQKKLFVFFQGHPEYEADTLLREYRRDVLRYLKGETPRYPSMPRDYFDRETVLALGALQLRSESCPKSELLPAIATVLGNIRIESTWRSSATSIYENWLRHIRAQKDSAMRSTIRKSVAHAPTIPAARQTFDVPAEV